MPDPERALWGGAVRLDAAALKTEDEKQLVWVQVAEGGAWKGHQAGEFELTEEIFQEIQRNFRNHPSFRAEPSPPDGRVIQWDFHHASEEHSSLVAVEGAPAQGWVYDVALGSEVPVNELNKKAKAYLEQCQADSKLTFWALTEWLPRAKGYVEDGSYQWASIAIWPDTTDPKSGENIGWYMSSIALTNDPFIQGMVPLSIAAMRSAALRHRHVQLSLPIHVALDDVYTLFSSWESCMAQMKKEGYSTEKAEKVCGSICGKRVQFDFDQCVKDVMASGKSEESAQKICGAAHNQTAERKLYRYYDPWDVPTTTADAFQRLKDIFEMGELASVVDVAAQLAELKSYASGAAPPPGVDVDKLIHQIRQLLQLELLTDSDTIFARCEELLARAAAESQAAQAAVATTRNPMPEPVDPNKLLLDTIAGRLDIPSNPEQVQKVVLTKLAAGEAALTQLGSILSALGVENAEGALDKIRTDAERVAELEAVFPELAELRELQTKDEEKDMEDDMAYAASRFGEQWKSLESVYRVYRGADLPLDPKSPQFKAQLLARKAAKKRFDEALPRLPAGQEHLLTSVATSPTPKAGAPAGPAAPQQLAQVGADGTLRLVASQPTAAPSSVIAPAPPPGNGAVELSAVRAEVEGHDGPNFGAKCIAYVQAKARAAGQALSWEDAHARGTYLAAQLRGQAPLAS